MRVELLAKGGPRAAVDIGRLHGFTKLVLGRSQWPVLYQHWCFVVKPGGSRVTTRVFVWSGWKKSSSGETMWVFCAAVSDGSGNAKKNRLLCLYVDSRLVPRFWENTPNTTEERKPHSPLTILDGNSLLSPVFECCNWTLRGSQKEVWYSVKTAHKSYISHLCGGSQFLALAFPGYTSPIAAAL